MHQFLELPREKRSYHVHPILFHRLVFRRFEEAPGERSDPWVRSPSLRQKPHWNGCILLTSKVSKYKPRRLALEREENVHLFKLRPWTLFYATVLFPQFLVENQLNPELGGSESFRHFEFRHFKGLPWSLKTIHSKTEKQVYARVFDSRLSELVFAGSNPRTDVQSWLILLSFSCFFLILFSSRSDRQCQRP